MCACDTTDLNLYIQSKNFYPDREWLTRNTVHPNERITLLVHKFFPLRTFLVTFIKDSTVQILLMVDLSVPREVLKLLRAGVAH
jgi:hypothetical protein